MNLRSLFNLSIIITVFSFLFISCNNEMGEIEKADVEAKSIAEFEKHKTIIASLGFDVAGIQEIENGYIVEGDILFQKDQMDSYQPRTKQARRDFVVDDSKVITVCANSTLPEAWANALKDAVNEWNNISLCKLKFSYLGVASSADIVISGYYENSKTIGVGSWPSSSVKPGSSIKINSMYNYLDAGLKKYTLVHELGHCLGLRHTDWSAIGESFAIHIGETSTRDLNSVMNSTLGTGWAGFSYSDILAFQTLWPTFKPGCLPDYISINITGYFSSTNPTFQASGNLSTIVKYEWTVNGSTSVRQSGYTVYATTYPECTYLNVILVATDAQGRKATFRQGFDKIR